MYQILGVFVSHNSVTVLFDLKTANRKDRRRAHAAESFLSLFLYVYSLKIIENENA